MKATKLCRHYEIVCSALSHGHGHGQLRQCKKASEHFDATPNLFYLSKVQFVCFALWLWLLSRDFSIIFQNEIPIFTSTKFIHLIKFIHWEKKIDDLTQWQLVLFTCSNTNAKWLIGICGVKWNRIYDAKKLFDWN